MRMIKALVIVAMITGVSGALLFSTASLITQAQIAATDTNLINIKSVYKTVWFNEPMPVEGYLTNQNAMGNSWGRGRIHLLIGQIGLTGEFKVIARFYAVLWKPDKSQYNPVFIAEYILDASTESVHSDLDVPSAQFFFVVYGPADVLLSVSYYLSV